MGGVRRSSAIRTIAFPQSRDNFERHRERSATTQSETCHRERSAAIHVFGFTSR
jgi:hypothetical protein